jgi:hypothetical protein
VVSVVVENWEAGVVECFEEEESVGECVGDESFTNVEFGHGAGDRLGGHNVGMKNHSCKAITLYLWSKDFSMESVCHSC